MRSTSTQAPPRPRNKKTRTGQYVAVDDISIRYLEAGAGNPGPVLLLLHGWRAGADLWSARTLPALASEFHVVAPDLPGYGNSARMPDHSLDSYAAFVSHFCDALRLDEVYLLGHSMGGQVAIGAASREPHRFRKLVLVSSAGLARTGPRWREPIEMLADSSARHWRLYPVGVRLAFSARTGRDALNMIRRDLVSNRLKALTMPTLIIWGSRDRIVPLEHGALMARLIPQARLAVIRGAGHMPFYQKPEEFMRLVSGFLHSPGHKSESTHPLEHAN